MGIDTDLLEKDIKNLMKYMSHGMSDHKVFENISSFALLNYLYMSLTGKYFDQNRVLPIDDQFSKRLDRYNYNLTASYLKDIDSNIDFLLQMFTNYNAILDEEDYYFLDHYGKMALFSEKEFRDILFDFFSKCGESQYKVVKKYFDEKRIELGSYDDSVAAYIYSIYLKSGYIVTYDNEINAKLLASVAHEFGHALDYELFIFPQQKKITTYSEILSEIPSCFYELLFIDYLKKNRIDGYVPDVLLNEKVSFLSTGKDDIESFKYADYFDINEDGSITTMDESIDLKDTVLYGLGYYYAFHLKFLYDNMDKTKFWKLYNDFISCRSKKSLEDLVSTLGFTYDDFISCKYIKPTVVSNVKTLKKRYNME